MNPAIKRVVLTNRSVGKNLFNGIWISGAFYSANGTISTNNTSNFCYVLNYIPVVAGIYTTGIAGIKISDWADMIFYDANKNYISGFHQNNNSTFTAPAGTKYARVSGNFVNRSTFQLERGSVATTYEFYTGFPLSM